MARRYMMHFAKEVFRNFKGRKFSKSEVRSLLRGRGISNENYRHLYDDIENGGFLKTINGVFYYRTRRKAA